MRRRRRKKVRKKSKKKKKRGIFERQKREKKTTKRKKKEKGKKIRDKTQAEKEREREREREREKISRKKTPPFHRDPAPIQIGKKVVSWVRKFEAREFEATLLTPLSLPFDTTTNRALVGVVVEGVEKCRRRRRRRASLRRDRLL